jgi:peptidoglycan/xylan/chitin deacetylase (PgdA/CDA1 family)
MSRRLAPRIAALMMAMLLCANPLLVTAQDTSQTSEVGIVVSTPAINIRDCPRSDCASIDSVALGGTLEVIGPVQDGFLPVRHGNNQGWAYALFIASSSTGTPVLTEGAKGCKRVALVFNVGIGDPIAWTIIDTLTLTNTPATMLIEGWWAEYYPAWVISFAESGFTIGTHGKDNLELNDRTTEDVMNDIVTATTQINTALGRASDTIFSPADASVDPRVLSMIAFAGYLPVVWQVSGGDASADATAEEVTSNVLDNIYDGAIVELHLDAPNSGGSTAVALPNIIETLQADGYTFVSIPDMAQPCA